MRSFNLFPRNMATEAIFFPSHFSRAYGRNKTSKFNVFLSNFPPSASVFAKSIRHSLLSFPRQVAFPADPLFRQGQCEARRRQGRPSFPPWLPPMKRRLCSKQGHGLKRESLAPPSFPIPRKKTELVDGSLWVVRLFLLCI